MDASIQHSLFGAEDASSTRPATGTLSRREDSASFESRLRAVDGSKLSAWNGYGLGYKVSVTLSKEDLLIAQRIADFAPTLFDAAKTKWRKEGLDFREFQPNIEDLETKWRRLFSNVGDYGLPNFDRIDGFKKTSDAINKAAKERGVYLAESDHPLNMVRTAGSALNFLYSLHGALIFEGRFTACHILTRAVAGISDASKRFLPLLSSKGARWFQELCEDISNGTDFYNLLCGGDYLRTNDWNAKTLDPIVRPISESMALNSSFDHPKFTKLIQILRQLTATEAKGGVIVLGGGGIESQRLAQQLYRVFPSSNVEALHGQSGKKIETKYIENFNRGATRLLVTDEKMVKRLGLKNSTLIVVYSSQPHHTLAKELIPRADENVQFVFERPK